MKIILWISVELFLKWKGLSKQTKKNEVVVSGYGKTTKRTNKDRKYSWSLATRLNPITWMGVKLMGAFELAT